MTETIIQVENLSKRYIIGHQQQGHNKYVALRDVLANGVKSFWKRFDKSKPALSNKEEFWALKDVSFEVKRGEVIGVIGRNGAGKSTLLKILSRITEPTTGKVRLKGRVASLLEVGTGFHPELTGRENIYLNGAVLGMKREEINRRFDEIVDFAEIEKFLDTPVKRYSSGMYMRLAFAVAAHLEPEILVVDEVLAVGDMGFQKKCLGKMGDVTTKEGRTVLFVSHNMSAINQLCKVCIWLKNGSIFKQGDCSEVVSNYLAYEQNNEENGVITKNHHYHDRPKGLIFNKITLLNRDGEGTSNLVFRENLRIFIECEVIEKVKDIRIGIVINSLEGKLITAFHQTEDFKCNLIDLAVGKYTISMETKLDIPPGTYNISLFTKPLPGFWTSQDPSWDYVENAFMFTVDFRQGQFDKILPSGSVILPEAQWLFDKID